MSLEKIAENKVFGGLHQRYTHHAKSTNTPMGFAIFLPPQAIQADRVPVLYWLSGLTCTDENFMQKAGAQRIAAELGIAIVAPDTSPRGEDVADDAGYDLGQGAGFYVNATEAPWSDHYQMYDYIVHELPKLVEANFPVTDKRAISGHSMGGHGAMTIALKNPDKFSSVSAFSPIVNPSACPWGQKALTAYLGENTDLWLEYDSTRLMASSSKHIPALVDQGTEDEFLSDQLLTDNLIKVADEVGYPLSLRYQDGYDHSYYFIASFIADHFRFHDDYLRKS